MRRNFHQQLEELKAQLMTMAHQVDRSFVDSIEAYRTADLALSQRVIGAEIQINRMEREIDRLAIDLLALEQPTAIDLRFILSIMRINSDLERIGDQAVSISTRVHELTSSPRYDFQVDIPLLAQHAREMLSIAMRAFHEGDADLANTVLALDDQVDTMNAEAFTSLSRLIADQPERAPQAMNMLIVSRNIERIADHATNIAEDVIFWRRGDDIRHAGSSHLT